LNQDLRDFQIRLKKVRDYLDPDSQTKQLEILQRDSEKSDFWTDKRKAQGILKEISIIKKNLKTYQTLESELSDSAELINLYKAEDLDANLINELTQSLGAFRKILEQFEIRMMLSGKDDTKNAILSINSGAGGTEAQDWAYMLSRMYLRYAEINNFKSEFLDILDGEEAGIKNCTILIKGEFAYGFLNNETGVHRLVRISPFDSNKRRHTSFASVSALPEVDEDIDISIDYKDLKIETFRASGAGGQHVNKTDSAVRVTHIPSGIVVGCQNQRSQHQNKASAMKILSSKLYDREMNKIKEHEKEFNSEKKDIGWGSQIRSYVLHPYKMIKDHRINFETGDVESFLDGNIQNLVQDLLSRKK
ncbi:MAG TPA: peptide chain release factor 2, partial [Candidatus Dadabacteria bacterium]|nr:peptide chain release factor 2 [Candidatus Dadabacteria bacterium]